MRAQSSDLFGACGGNHIDNQTMKMVSYCTFDYAVKLIFRQRLQMSENRDSNFTFD